MSLHSASAPPAPDLLDLVPPNSGLVTGLEKGFGDAGRPSVFIPLAGKGLRDYDYFLSLIGADPQRSVAEIIFAEDNIQRTTFDHSLLALGRFDTPLLYKSALGLGAVAEKYRDIDVLNIPPLPRERPYFADISWLAILHSRILLLGTPNSVREELDRFLAGGRAALDLRQKFASVQQNVGWWIVLKHFDNGAVRDALSSLSPDLAELMNGRNSCVGMRFGRKVIFEYQVESSDAAQSSFTQNDAVACGDCRERPFTAISRLQRAPAQTSARGEIRIPTSRYKAWIDGIAGHPHEYNDRSRQH